jgi:hypothetical protein
MTCRRAAALALLALLAVGCGSSSSPSHGRLTATGPEGVVRIALARLLWPLDPARATGRDEIALARVLFSTPLRTDPVTGALRPGLCARWSSSRGDRTWRLRCGNATALAQTLRRRIPGVTRVERRGPHTLVVSLRAPEPQFPYELTSVAAAPPSVPGPFQLVSASPTMIVARRPGLRLVFRRLEPHAALREFRAGRLDETPVPLGDLQASLRDSELKQAVRVQRLLAVDLVAFDLRRGSLARLPEVRRVYDATADRADYQALVPEFEAPPAENLVDRGPPNARKALLRTRRARQEIPSLPKVAVRFAVPADPDLAYGEGLLVAAWRDLGLGATLGGKPPDARFERLLAAYPLLEALTAAAPAGAIPIAWAVDARLVSPRLRGWREDELGAVDYTRVTAPASK